jgi:hypothetical protein
MRFSLSNDKKLQTILHNQEEMKKIMALTLEALEAVLDQTKANLIEASAELEAQVSALKEFLGDDDPARAVAKLDEILEMSRRLADIVPNK